jgi:hypothetical protein
MQERRTKTLKQVMSLTHSRNVGIPFADPYLDLSRRSAHIDVLLVRSRPYCDRLLCEPVEKETPGSRMPSFKAKSQLISIVVKLLELMPTLMRSQEPSLEKRDNSVYAWHNYMG